MRGLSALGAKKVMQPLLDAMAADQWRVKLGSIELLGAMAACAGKHLASVLPQIVPALCTGVTDSHIKVGKGSGPIINVITRIVL